MAVIRVHGGALNSQTLAGSLRYFQITGGVGGEFEYTLGGYPSGAVATPANFEQRVNSGTIVSGGTGYLSGDVLTVSGGTTFGGGAATFTVAAVSGGAVTRITPLAVGEYEVAPANPVATTTGGGGSNCTLNLEFTGVVVALGTNTYIGAAAPVPKSAADQVCEVIMQNATIVQIALVPSLIGDVIQVAVESESMGWLYEEGAELAFTSLAFADANPDTIIRTGGADLTLTFSAGDLVRVSSSEVGGQNDGVYEIATVNSTTIVLTALGSLVANADDTTATLSLVTDELRDAIRAMGTITVPYFTSVGDTFNMSAALVTEKFLTDGFI